MFRSCLYSLVLLVSFHSSANGFLSFEYTRQRTSIAVLKIVKDLERPSTFLDSHGDDGDDDDDNDTVEFDERNQDENDDFNENQEGIRGKSQNRPRPNRWESLNPKVKVRLIEKGQARAIANKKKREPIQEKKRRK